MQPQTERRASPRQRTLLAATGRENGRAVTWTGAVRNLSDNGARIEVGNALWPSAHFELDIPVKDIRRPARVVWRSGQMLGVAFDDTSSAVVSADNELRALREERNRLRARLGDLLG